MPYFDMPIVVSVYADTYVDAIMEVDAIAAGLGDMEQIPVSQPAPEYDNEGQRVYYLHPEDQPSENG